MKQRLRFKNKDGNDFVEWTETTLGEVGWIVTGKKNLEDKMENGKYPFFVRSKNIEKIDAYSYDEEAILVPGDGQIGEVYHYVNGKFDCHQRVYKITSKSEDLHMIYLLYFMKTYFKNEAIKNDVKATVSSLRMPTFINFPISLPCLEEQEKIASFLSTLDEVIETKKGELELRRQYKQGVMQKLFSQELRFKDNDYTEWTETTLGEVGQILRGGSPRPIQKYITKDKDGINWLKIGDIPKGGKYVFKTEEKIILEGAKHSRLVNENDFIISNSMSFGRPYIMKTKACIHDGWLTLTLKNKQSTEFFYYLFISTHTQDKFRELAQGSSVNNLKKETVQSLPISLPCLEEQEKIASFLSTLDEVIEASASSIKLLQEHKKALMQAIFTKP